jgi:predicted Zn-dependent protease
MRVAAWLLPLAILLLTSAPAGAERHAATAGKVTVDLPKDWKVDAAADMIRAASADDAIAFALFVVATADAKAALQKLERDLYSSVQGLKWVDRQKKVKINKLAGTFVEGVGVSARSTQLDVLVLVAGPTPAKSGVILLGVVEHDKLPAQRKTLQKIFESLKPTP